VLVSVQSPASLRTSIPVNLVHYKYFIIKSEYTFEVGGKEKGFNQISGVEKSFVVADDIKTGFGNKIPLWLFGFFY